MIRLPKQVRNNDVLKRLMYFNAFTVGDMISEQVSEEAVSIVMISMIGMGGFAHDEREEEYRSRG